MNMKRFFFLGIPIIFIIGSLFHFIYELTGNLFIVGLLTPVNESVFEHMKLAFLPTVLYFAGYCAFAEKKPDRNKFTFAAVISQITNALLMPLIFYGYTQAFGVECILADILIYLVSTASGQLLAAHFYKYGKAPDYRIGIAVTAALVILFAYWTAYPPNLPLFGDPTA